MRQSRSRYIEGGLLCAGLIAATAFAVIRPGPPLQAGALAFLPLPFLLWAAVRFGVCMTGVSLLVLGYLSTWLAVHVTHNNWLLTTAIVPTLQLQLLAIAVPVLCLAAVVQERQAAAMALALSQHALHQSLAELRNVGGRLLTAAERERARVARELHDDVGQHLAVFAIGLNRLQRRLPDDALLRREVSALQRQALTVAEGVRSLSHELHPGTLQHAGLVPAVRELCAQFERRESMRADLTVQGGDIEVATDVALCAYRVTQEALRNAARHSGARTAKVTIAATVSSLELTVADEGRGFDDSAVRQRGGLGLTSIDERVRIVGGTVDLATAPGHGTRIVVRLPRGNPQ
jgi:two-component system sensor histidine kinase UhpB